MLSEFLTQDILGQFTDPKKRLFFGYVMSALFIAFLWLLFVKKQTAGQSVREIIAPQIWLSKSSRIDAICFIINRIFFFFLQPVLITQIAIATILFHWLHSQTILHVNVFASAPYWLAASSFTLVFFLFDDFARFITHLALHKIPALWEFHKFHHSAEHLTPLTVTRTHPVEGIIFGLRSAIVQGTTIALFVFLFGNEIGLVTIYGVNMFVVLFHGLGSNLRHSHIAIRYPKAVEIFLMSPAQHQLHHSDNPKHFDKNFGVALSLWDWICGTFHHSTDKPLKFGLGSGTESSSHSLLTLYLAPFLSLGKYLPKRK
ncbi:MAG: sterol desaturase family protein [Candidatus Puniceispirillaceae bacterium]